MTTPLEGRVHRVLVSDGGVPKHAVPSAEVTADGLAGDRQRDLRHHGGPQRAVCLLGLDVIQRLAAEGHPIEPGSTGENVTVAGIDWATVGEGSRLRFERGVELEVTGFATPCRNISGSFLDGRHDTLSVKRNPGGSRVYARVVEPGVIAAGDGVELLG